MQDKERREDQGSDAEDRENSGRQPRPDDYPLDPGAAYGSEPEPADETFSEQQHWVERRNR